MDPVEVQAFLIADSVMRDSQYGKFTITGVFENIWAQSFPVAIARLAVYFRVRIQDRTVRQTVSLSRVSPSGLRENFPVTDLALAPNGIGQGSIDLLGFPFPSPGEYRIELIIDDAAVAGFVLKAQTMVQSSVTGGTDVANRN